MERLTLRINRRFVSGLACGLLALGLCGDPAAAGTPESRTDCYGDPLPSGAVARLGTVRFLPRAGAWAVALSPDGRLVATGTFPGSESNAVELWDAESGAVVGTLADGTNNILSLAFSPDGRQLAVSHAGRVEVFDAAKRKSLGELEQVAGRPAGAYWLVRWSPDGNYLAAVCYSGRAAMWDASSRKLVHSAAYDHEALGIAFSQDNRLLAVCGDKLLETRRASDFKVQMKADDVSVKVDSVAFSPDGKTLAGGVELATPPDSKSPHRDRRVRLWDAGTGKVRGETATFKGSPSEVAYLPDGKTVVAVGWGCAVHAWSSDTLKEQWTLSTVGYIGRHFAISADARTIATADRRIALWDLATGRQRHSWATHSHNVFSAAFTADGGAILSTGGEGIRSWDAASGRLLRCLPGTESSVFSTLAISHDGRTVAAGKATDICLWEWPSWKVLGKLAGHKATEMGNPVTSLDFAPGDAVLVSGGWDRTVRFWDMATRQQTRSLDLPQPIARVRFSPDGKIAAAGQFCGDVVLLEAVTGKRLDAIAGSQGLFFGAMDFLPAGPFLVVPKYRGVTPEELGRGGLTRPYAVRLWDYKEKKELWTSERLPFLNCIAVSHDGRIVATGGFPPRDWIRLFSAKSGRPLAEFRGHYDCVRAISFSPDDSRMLTASQDGTLLLWKVPPPQGD
jgi:WD40 repeat protein